MAEYQLLIGDSFEHTCDMDDESIDLIVTDPPYASLEIHRSIGTTTRLKGDWFEVISNAKLERYLHEMYRVLKDNTHAYIICDQTTMFFVRDACARTGFTFKKFLVWDKVAIGMGYSWRSRHEVICYLEKGKRKLNNLGWPDVLTHKRVVNGYPTEKPVSLFQQLIENSSNKGDIVYDPFCGSGASIEAALSVDRNVIASELKQQQEDKIDNRIVDAEFVQKKSDNLYINRKQFKLSGF